MSQSISSALEQLPEGAIQLCQDRVLMFNQAAAALFPQLTVGAPLPAALAGLFRDQTAGVFTHQGQEIVFHRLPLDRCQLLLLRPAAPFSITGRQLDGFVRQMRTFMQNMLLPVDLLSDDLLQAGGDPTQRQAAFHKTYCRMYRMLSNLDCLHHLGTPHDLFQPITMDLAGLCAQISREADSMLREAGVTLTYRCTVPSLLMPGDPALLTKLILTLLSNAVKAAPQGAVFLTLAQRRDRAILSVTDSGQDFAQEDLESLFPPPVSDDRIPGPQEGAGLGLAIARRIASLHKGALLLERRESGALLCVVSLPTGPLDPHLEVRAPRMEDSGGYSPVLVELSDVLPQSLFCSEDLD